MACPEWEEVDFEGTIADQLKPDWRSVNLHGYVRPRWFAQGPLRLCLDYLIAKRSGRQALAACLWRELGEANLTQKSAPRPAVIGLRWLARARDEYVRARDWPAAAGRWWAALQSWGVAGNYVGWLGAAFVAPIVMTGLVLLQLIPGKRQSLPVQWPVTASADLPEVIATQLFAAVFPDRKDRLTAVECAPYFSNLPKWVELFSYYDIVQAYSTDVVHPLLAGKRPYLGFEHGTLREFTLGDSSTCRLTALGYQQADHVLITNGDCLEYARKIKVSSYTPMVHPIDDRRLRAIPGDYDGYHRQFGTSRLFVCTLRHDWSIKGTDKYIRALPGLVGSLGRDFRVVMVQWGMDLDRSRELAAALGVEDLIVWLQPLKRSALVRLQKSADVVFDQIALPHFGATAPQALAAGVPVIMSYDPASTEWIIPEPAPILPAWTVDEIVGAVETALDPVWRKDYVVRARRWFDTYHSGDRAVDLLSAAYDDVLRKTRLL
jgi:glycosyltransferase involved in cell wall biosynthesis